MGKNQPPLPPPVNKNRLKAALDLTDNSADRSYGDDEIRGGCRGGRAHFSWDAVKADKQRNMYLGNSVMANIWRSARPSDWYTERTLGKDDADLQRVKDEEATVARVTQKFGYGALGELEKYKTLLEEEERAAKKPVQTNQRVFSLKEELRTEMNRGYRSIK